MLLIGTSEDETPYCSPQTVPRNYDKNHQASNLLGYDRVLNALIHGKRRKLIHRGTDHLEARYYSI